MKDSIKKASVLLEALPYIREFYGTTFVVKYGGSAQIDPAVRESVAQDLVLLKLVGINVVVVHGGGKHINEALEKYGIVSEFRDGLRVTSPEAMEITEMVLSGKANKEIVTLINKHGGNAVGLSGKDGPLLFARALLDSQGGNYGRVGEIEHVDDRVLQHLESGGYIPVISPVASSKDGSTYNVNADTAAGKIAQALKAAKLIYLTDVDGVYKDLDNKQDMYSVLSRAEVHSLIDQGIIKGGMLPKVRSIIESLEHGVGKVHSINGMVEHALLLEIFTRGGIGTAFVLE